MSPDDEGPTLPPLEADIPKDHLPDILHVYDKRALALLRITRSYYSCNKEKPFMISADDPEGIAAFRNWKKFLARCHVRFVRQYPTIWFPPLKLIDDRCIIGDLDLSQGKCLGDSNHAYVTLASLSLPHREAPSLHGEVAVKLAKENWRDRRMLEDEANIYDKFPCELQQCTSESPPVVPKFYGYYIPSWDCANNYRDEDEEDTKIVRKDVRMLLRTAVSPILLLEPCGQPIEASKISSDPAALLGIFDRLHDARFIQRSVYARNILVQPGPLTHPRAERSPDNPSFRLIDFGRGACFDGDESDDADRKIALERDSVRYRISYGML